MPSNGKQDQDPDKDIDTEYDKEKMKEDIPNPSSFLLSNT